MEATVRFCGRLGPVSGTVSFRGGTPAEFHGWLELMDALEQGREPHAGSAPGAGPGERLGPSL